LGFRDRDSRLWFAMGAGLSSLEPMPPQPQAAFPILVTALRVGGTDHPLSPWGEALLTRVELGPSQNHLEFGFVAPFFGAGEGPKYQHKLEGADADWSAADARRSIHYASLAPGRYRFQVRSVIAGAAAVPAARVEFTIQPPVWRRWWFQGLALACLCSLAYAFHRFRVRRAVELERVRMRIATDLHDELGAGLSQVAILSEVGKIEGRRDDALGKIGQLAREMLEATGDLVWAIRPHRDRLSDLVQRMRELAGDVLLESGVELRFTAPERDLRLGPDARRQVFLVFKECLHNVARHAGATAVEIDLSVEDHLLTLRVSDNGSGFRTDAVSGSATRHGLAGARWRAESLGGSFELVSEPGRGATARLRIPLRKSVGAQRRGLP
jgi:signal transduction histidine kinase